MRPPKAKCVALGLSAFMIMQSCIAYYKNPVTINEAIATNDKVKIITPENEVYKFYKLVKDEDKLYGIKGLIEGEVDPLAPYVKEIDTYNKLVKVLLSFPIKEVYIKNKTKTDLINSSFFIIPLVVLIIHVLIKNNDATLGSPITL